MNSVQALDSAIKLLNRDLVAIWRRVNNNPHLVAGVAGVQINTLEETIETLTTLRELIADSYPAEQKVGTR